MESNALPGGMYGNRNAEMLGLEMSLHHHIPLPQNPSQVAMSYGHNEGDYRPQIQKALKQGYSCSAKSKNQSLNLSDDDEPGITAENSADDGKKKSSPWQRMKWTDDMVRLLIMVVFYIGDEVCSEGNDPSSKRKSGGVLQKKGKWKSVSQALMERGFYVSPQQCEDKFNDLNKRYKRVNDILGKGTACQVVENQSLLDSMNHLSPKMKEEVKKLLNSKHLFFREMCAYHNSCGHGGSSSGSGIGVATGGVHHSPPDAAEDQRQMCLHSSGNTPSIPTLKRGENKACNTVKGVIVEEEEYEDEDEDDDEEEEDDDDEVIGGESIFHDRACYGETHDMDELPIGKRERKGSFCSSLIQQLDADLTNMLHDGVKSTFEKRQWMQTKLMQLEEHSVSIQYQTLELEKQRLKWLKFSTKKERELEREKLLNEQLKVENERMVLLIRKKEHDFLDHIQNQQRPSNKNYGPSPVSRRID